MGRDSREAEATTGTVERTSLYQLLGRRKDEALARRALELALTNEPGKTVSAGLITRRRPASAARDRFRPRASRAGQSADRHLRAFRLHAATGRSEPRCGADPGPRELCEGEPRGERPQADPAGHRPHPVQILAAASHPCETAAWLQAHPARVDRRAFFVIGARSHRGLPWRATVRDSCVPRFADLNLQPRRGQESFEAVSRFVVRCLVAAPSIQAPRTRVLGLAPKLLLKLARSNSGETLELAWIVRKKPIWSTS